MVGVAVGDKHVADVLKGDFRLDELLQNAVATTAVNEHTALGRVEVEAGVVAVDAHGITRAKHGDA